MDTLGKRLRWARETAQDRMSLHRKVTQAWLASVAGVSRNAVTQIETDRNTSSYAMDMPTVADFLGVNLGWLLTGSGSATADLTASKSEKLSAEGVENTVTNEEDLLDLISHIHGLTTQILANSKEGRSWNRPKISLKAACREFCLSSD